MNSIESGLKVSGSAIAINIILALIKITTGIIGSSYALIADGIESTMDIVSSLIVWGSLRISIKPPDKDHPYGHGKADSLAGMAVASSLLIASVIIAIQSIREIRTPHHAPAWYTLAVLVGIIISKEILFRKMTRIGTSVAAFVGITIALVGGPGYEVADDWAALAACVVILYNGIRLLLPALNEVMDGAVPDDIDKNVRKIASQVNGVLEIEKCRIRKSGIGLLMDLHVVVRGDISVREGHIIGHEVKDHLLNSDLQISDVTVHIEPGSLTKTNH